MLFNLIAEYECIPCHFKRGIIVPIPKCGKYLLYQDHYRGITLIPVIAKIYEKCILKRVESNKIIKEIIDELQGVVKAECSSLHTAWLLKEVIAGYVENGQTVHVGLLDIKKAYDTIWQDGMLYKLFKYGINGKTWRLIRSFYKDFNCQVKFGTLSELFSALQGIHQGAPCSTLLFVLFENELLRLLKNLRSNANLCDINVACPSFADDISIVSLTKQDMQKMFNTAYEYSCKWRFQFSPQKCKILIFGRDQSPKYEIKLGNDVIEQSCCETHLGVGLYTNKKSEISYIEKRISKCKSIVYSTQAIGSKHVPMLPVTASKLYWNVCIPKLTYGFEIMDINPQSIEKITSFHAHAAKCIQGLPDQAVNIGCLATAGWQPIDMFIDLIRLLFMWRILLLPMSNIYKKVFIRRFYQNIINDNSHGPVKKFIDTCVKYNLLYYVINAIEAGNYCSKTQFKQMVKLILKDRYDKRFKITLPLYKSLCYMHESTICMSPWWYLAHTIPSKCKQVRLVIQLLLNKERHNHSHNKCCDLIINFNIHHVLFECSSMDNIRNVYWKNVENVMPTAMLKCFNKMSNSEKCNFILSGFKSQFIPEWTNLYISMCEFIYKVYTKYATEFL